MPDAARITDPHSCPKHGGGPIISGEMTVIIGGQPAARVSDKEICGPAMDAISKGERTVKIGNKDAARMGDPCEHGGNVTRGCPTVRIGSANVSGCLKKAAEQGSAMVQQSGSE